MANGNRRSEIHPEGTVSRRLYDRAWGTVTSDLHLEVSSRIREEWFNGKAYYRLHGQRLANLPADRQHYPSATFLSWHNENRYQG